MILTGNALDVLRTLGPQSVQCCVTSPPYWGLRDYGVKGQLGLEPTPELYVSRMVEIFREVRRVLKDDGTLWLNLGDSYAGSCMTGGNNSLNQTTTQKSYGITRQFRAKKELSGLKPKDLVGIPWRVAFALQADGWYLRSDIIWHKPNPMPESVTDRPTKAHEYLFLLAKARRYFYDAAAVSEPAVCVGDSRHLRLCKTTLAARPDHGSRARTGNPQAETRNRRTVWSICSKPYKGAHFATFPPKLIEPCILAGSRPGDVVLDPFAGAGTTWLVSQQHNRKFLGIELNPKYTKLAESRVQPQMAASA